MRRIIDRNATVQKGNPKPRIRRLRGLETVPGGASAGVNGRGDGLRKSGDILYTKEMPWMETDAKKQRHQFYRDDASSQRIRARSE